jgi:phosphoribosyl 1,2-cyclic phosphodiesterase
VGLAEAAGVGRLLLFHHDPPRTDDQIDSIVACYRDAAVLVEGAAEGMVIDVP